MPMLLEESFRVSPPTHVHVYSLLLFTVLITARVSAFLGGNNIFGKPPICRYRTASLSMTVISALESIAQELNITDLWLEDQERSHKDGCVNGRIDEDAKDVPLYPLPAVYLPMGSQVNFTLNNVEPRNIQMALDLMNGTSTPKFCASLRTIDTGRIATIGTLMRIVDQNPHSVQGSIRRITLTCVAEDLVDIIAIENPEAYEMAYRLKNPRVYLRAAVKKRALLVDESTAVAEARVAETLNSVRSWLIYNAGLSKLRLKLDIEQLEQSFPAVKETKWSQEYFWCVAQQWQMLCNTLQEAFRSRFIATRNEMLVSAALKMDGPLNLPVQFSRLDKTDRAKIEQFDVESQKEWVALGMDPTIAFQGLVQITSYNERLVYLHQMIERAKERLECEAAEIPLRPNEGNLVPQEPKGAWFDDGLW